MQEHVVDEEVRLRLNRLLTQQEQPDRCERESERVDIALVDLLLDHLAIDLDRFEALFAVERD
jgi:hypothetical protein